LGALFNKVYQRFPYANSAYDFFKFRRGLSIYILNTYYNEHSHDFTNYQGYFYFYFFAIKKGGSVHYGRNLIVLISHVMAGFQWQPANQIPNYGNT
jgi:hypothetical protein